MLGIIAGGGNLPLMLCEHLKKEGRPFFVIALKGFALDKDYENVPKETLRLGGIRDILKTLKRENVKTLVFAGSVPRPSLTDLRPDMTALKWFAKLGAQAFGDDGLFKGMVSLVENEGFQVAGIQDLLPHILTPEGFLGEGTGTNADLADIQKGILVAKTLGQLDIGQAVIIENGLTLAVEAIEGTALLLKRAKDLKRDLKGGVLIKAAKPQQENRIDLPTIGPDTVIQAADCGLHGIAIESGAGLIIEPQKTIALANECGLFLYGFKP